MNVLPGYIARSLWLAFCGLAFLAPLTAQEWRAWEQGHSPVETAFIYHAEGGDFAITLRGEQAVFDAEAAGSQTIILERSGIVHTGAGTFLVIRFAPSGAMIMLSEHTSLVYNGIDETGMFADVVLLYGRVRADTGEAGFDGIRSIVIRCGGVSSRVIEGDMGVDYLLEPGHFAAVPLFRLDSFRGSAEVFPYGAGGAAAYFGGVQSLTVQEGESLSLDLSSSRAFVERRPLRGDIAEYWRSRAFGGILPVPDAALVEDAAAGEEPLELALPPAVAEAAHEALPWEREPLVVVSSSRNRGLLWLGLGLMAASVAVQGAAHHSPGMFPNDTAAMARSGSYGLFGAGALFSIMGILRSPQPPAR